MSKYTLEHGDVWLGNDVIGLSAIVDQLNVSAQRIVDLEAELSESERLRSQLVHKVEHERPMIDALIASGRYTRISRNGS